MEPTPALRPMTARSVAEIGYEAMLKGRPVVVAGWKNKLMVAVSRRAPTMWFRSRGRKIKQGPLTENILELAPAVRIPYGAC